MIRHIIESIEGMAPYNRAPTPPSRMDKSEKQLDFPTVQRDLKIKTLMTEGHCRDVTIQTSENTSKDRATHPVPTVIASSVATKGTFSNDDVAQKTAARGRQKTVENIFEIGHAMPPRNARRQFNKVCLQRFPRQVRAFDAPFKLSERISCSHLQHEVVQLAMQLTAVKLVGAELLQVAVRRNPSDTFEQSSSNDKMKQGSRNANQVIGRHEIIRAQLRNFMLDNLDLAFINDPSTLEHVRS
jgi:hypothetical protein